MSGLIYPIDWTASWTDEHPDRRMVANLSLGGTSPYRGPTSCGDAGVGGDPEQAAFCGAVAKGFVFVVAAGNDSRDAVLTIPARNDEVITVSAIVDYALRSGVPLLAGSLSIWMARAVATVDLAAATTHDRRVVWSATWPTRATRQIVIRTLDSPGADTVWLDAMLTLR